MTIVCLGRSLRLGMLWLAVLGACAPGCAVIRVRRAERLPLLEGWRASALTCSELSPRSQQTLRSYDLEKVYQRCPAEAAARLHAEALRDPQPDLLFALAEINFLRGHEAEAKAHPDAVAYYYLCAGYAYHYLFRPPADDYHAGSAAAFDPRFRLACDLYNNGLSKCILAAQHVGQLDPRCQLRLSAGDGKEFVLSVVHHGFPWKPEEFGTLRLSADYHVEGLPNQHRTYGLGVPLIATRAGRPSQGAPAYYPDGVSFPVTAFFRFEGSLAELGERRAGRLELYNPLAYQGVRVAGRKVPLETDLTTPLAYYLAHAQTRLEIGGLTGFVQPDSLRDRAGIYTLEPYQPGKVPVVLVHGLLSSPLTWAPAYNDLLADPTLRKRYQFWAYFYPTGNPYMATAADLRRELARLRSDLDPQHRDRALDEIVFIGHSMGGLVSKLMTVGGGDDFWRQVSDVPLRELKLRPDTRAELEGVFYFEPQPCVRRVIFLGTPHHGSRLSPSSLGRLAVHLVSLPHALMAAAHDVVAENPELEKGKHEQPIPTSVDLLAPGAPALELLAARKPAAGVHYHSIIGVTPANNLVVERWFGGGGGPSDGVVPYASAHLEGVDSELVVPADHYSVHHHPLAVLEVRRILLEHLREVDARVGLGKERNSRAKFKGSACPASP
jgi:pimeloyl-ACP methyl ester carboxylesterase